MSTSRLAGALGLVYLALCTAAAISPHVDPDMFHGLALAREFVRSGHLPRQDVFAYTPTLPLVVHHEWLAFTFVYALIDRFGALGLTVLALAMQSGIVVALLLLARWQGARLPMLCLLTPLGLTLLSPGLTTLRAQVWSLACTAGVLALLEVDRRGRRWWIVPYLVMHTVWLNLHGGFVIGLGLVVLHAVEQALRRRPVMHLVAAIAAACALTVVNPYGPAYVGYLWEALTMDRSMILEWRPLGEGGYPLAFVAWGLSVLLIVYGVARKGLGRAPGILLLVVTALLALRVQRHVSIYAIVWLAQVPPLLAGTQLDALVERWWTTLPRRVVAALLVGIVWAASRTVTVAPWRLDLPTKPGKWAVAFPAGAVGYLEDSKFHGNLMTPFELGAFVSWKMYPDVHVSLDGRFEVAYPHQVVADHITFYEANPGWQAARDKYPTDAVLVPVSAPVANALRADGAWPLVYQDDAYQIYMRPERAAQLARVDRRGQIPPGTFP